ncbi:MAG: GWxTD domain-containing protein [Melioribacteraceae bacterium]|nr:GWxTD domain-containing protein [Melioribacteraceae bacterium]
MRLFTIVILLGVVFSISAQQRHRGTNVPERPREVLFYDSIVIPSNDSFKIYFTYKIGYNNLFFVKTNGLFNSGLTFNIEVMGDDKVVFRGSDEKNISVADYELTESKENFVNGIIEFELEEGKYNLRPFIKLENTNQEFKLRQLPLSLSSEDSLIKPIVIDSESLICNSDTLTKLLNFRNTLIFGEYGNIILFTVPNNYDEVSIEFIQNGKSISNKFYKSSGQGSLLLESCDNDLAVKIDGSELKYNFVFVDGISKYLDEGFADVVLSFEDKKHNYKIETFWLDKPRSLGNIEIAVDALELIADDESISKITSLDDRDKLRGIKDYFKEYDPDITTPFNPVMNEFYQRVDYAVVEFSNIDEPNGLKTDFGKIYVLYGTPDNRQRTYSESNEIIEIWSYNKIDLKFYFKDKTGMGNFKLIKQ